jgi:hypothetical protein
LSIFLLGGGDGGIGEVGLSFFGLLSRTPLAGELPGPGFSPGRGFKGIFGGLFDGGILGEDESDDFGTGSGLS